MMPQERVIDIMRRTMKNLEFIREYKKNGCEVYEVTQLVNSFLGALAHPWEVYREKLNDMPLDVAVTHGWPTIKKELKSDKNICSLGELVQHMRNGIAHGHVTFKADRQNEINEICVEDKILKITSASGALSSQSKIWQCF